MLFIRSVLLSLSLLSLTVKSQDLEIYSLLSSENKQGHSFSFVSLGLDYPFVAHPDSLVIADGYLGAMDYDYSTDNYHPVEAVYRKRFLSRLKIKESDNIYLYHLLLDTVYSFNVKDLKLVAFFDGYGASLPVSDNDYMIGFEIGNEALFSRNAGRFSKHVFVNIGTKDPFQTGQVKPIKWKKSKNLNFPRPKNEAELRENVLANSTNLTYKYEQAHLGYYLQSYLDSEGCLLGQWLIVIDRVNKTEVYNKFMRGSEGMRLLETNSVNSDYDEHNYQFTGRLFKDQPPIIYNFYYHRFGCDIIHFVEKKEHFIRRNCGARS
jgi:hypothetical protein